MLSSLNAYGGLSAAEILTLFGANSSSSPASATAASSAQSSSSQVAASSTDSVINTLQAILAQSQIDHAKLEASLAGSTSTATARAAYAEQTQLSAVAATTTVTTETASTVQVGASTTMSGQYSYAQGNGFSFSSSYSVTSVPIAYTPDATNGTTSQTEYADYFQLGVTIDNDSYVVGFTVDGLGQVGSLPSVGGVGVSVGDGNEWALPQMVAELDGGQDGCITFDFDISGLNVAQEQQVEKAFNQATASTNGENLGGGFSVYSSTG